MRVYEFKCRGCEKHFDLCSLEPAVCDVCESDVPLARVWSVRLNISHLRER
jgi:rRNA maturation endonuclease Nob1